MSAAVSSWTLRYFGFDDCVASCKSANTRLVGLDVFTVHMYIASKLLSSESLTCTLCGDFVNVQYSIHLFNSVHICALWFCEALAGETSIFLTFLALEPGYRTFESWSVSCVFTAFTYVWIKGCLRFWFVLFFSCPCGWPCWGFGLNGFFVGWLCKC